MAEIWMDVDTALGEVPVNVMPLIDDGDFKTIEDAVAYNAAGMDLRWNFVTTAGAYTSTPVTPTSGGDYDWGNQGDGMYTIEIPASGGASINNDTEGFGWFSGKATGVLPWRGPVIGFRAAAINDALIDGGDLLDVNVTQFGGNNGAFASGRPEVNTTHLAGTSQTARDIGASVLLSSGTGTGQVSLSSGSVTVGTNNDKTGYSTIDVLATGTAQAGGVNTITLASGASSVDDFYKGALLIATGGTGAGQGKLITGYVGSTKVATVDGTWPVTPDNTTTYAALGSNFSVGLYNTVVTNLDVQASSLATQTSVDDVYTDTQSIVAKLPGRAFLAGTDNVSGSIQSDDVEAIAVEVESHLLDEGDSQMLINAIVGAIGNTNVDQAVLVAAIRADLERTGGTLDVIDDKLPALVGGRVDVSVGAYQSGLAPLQPTTAGRKLDVTTGGAAGIDWGNVENVTTIHDFTSTTIGVVTSVVTVGAVNGLNAGAIGENTIAGLEIARIQSGLATQASVDDIPTNSEFSTALADIKGATFDTSTDSLEALRNRGDAAWVTATGFATSSALAAITGTNGALIGSEADGYPAQIEFTVDGANTRDEYTVSWFKNLTPLSAGITSPTIQVVKRADGTDLIAEASLTQIGSTGTYRFNTTTEGQRLTEGEAAIVIVTATIDGSERTWKRLISRDAEAA